LAIKKPTPLEKLAPVTPRAISIERALIANDITKYRFRTGCWLIGTGVAVFLIGHFLPITRYFAPSFTDRAWWMARALLVLGVSFAGKEVAEALVMVLKSWNQPPS
jgi:hypothetical protein